MFVSAIQHHSASRSGQQVTHTEQLCQPRDSGSFGLNMEDDEEDPFVPLPAISVTDFIEELEDLPEHGMSKDGYGHEELGSEEEKEMLRGAPTPATSQAGDQPGSEAVRARCFQNTC